MLVITNAVKGCYFALDYLMMIHLYVCRLRGYTMLQAVAKLPYGLARRPYWMGAYKMMPLHLLDS